MPGDERSLAVVGPGQVIVAVHLEELGQRVSGPLGLAYYNVGNARPLNGTIAGEGEPGGLRYEVLRVSHVRGVIQLADAHVDASAFLDGLKAGSRNTL